MEYKDCCFVYEKVKDFCDKLKSNQEKLKYLYWIIKEYRQENFAPVKVDPRDYLVKGVDYEDYYYEGDFEKRILTEIDYLKKSMTIENNEKPDQTSETGEDVDMETEEVGHVEDEKKPKSIEIKFNEDNRQISYNGKLTGRLSKPQFLIVKYLYENGKTIYTRINGHIEKELCKKYSYIYINEYFKGTKHNYVYKDLINSDYSGSYFIKST